MAFGSAVGSCAKVGQWQVSLQLLHCIFDLFGQKFDMKTCLVLVCHAGLREGAGVTMRSLGMKSSWDKKATS